MSGQIALWIGTVAAAFAAGWAVFAWIADRRKAAANALKQEEKEEAIALDQRLKHEVSVLEQEIRTARQRADEINGVMDGLLNHYNGYSTLSAPRRVVDDQQSNVRKALDQWRIKLIEASNRLPADHASSLCVEDALDAAMFFIDVLRPRDSVRALKENDKAMERLDAFDGRTKRAMERMQKARVVSER